jgi:hypothetical protein
MIAVLIAAALAAQQAEPAARIAGRVLIRGENTPVAMVLVALMQQEPSLDPGRHQAPVAATDANGRFSFAAAPGRYTFHASKMGFVFTSTMSMPGTIRVAEGQSLENIQIFLDRGAVIASRRFPCRASSSTTTASRSTESW